MSAYDVVKQAQDELMQRNLEDCLLRNTCNSRTIRGINILNSVLMYLDSANEEVLHAIRL